MIGKILTQPSDAVVEAPAQTGVATVDVYDIETQIWYNTSLIVARYWAAAASFGTKIVIAGGFLNPFQHSRAVDVFDVSTETWVSSSTALSAARSFIGAAALGGKIVFAGGSYDSCLIFLLVLLFLFVTCVFPVTASMRTLASQMSTFMMWTLASGL